MAFIDPNKMMYTASEPKLRNRFTFEIDGIPVAYIKKAGRPKATSGEVIMPHINVEWYSKGKSKWEPIDIEIYDFIAPSGMQIVMEFFRIQHESVTGRDGYRDSYVRDCTLNILGPVGDIVENWTLKSAWMVSFDGGEFDWSTEDEAAVISATFRFDHAILNY